ncbi:hypothetical protein Riv7116_6161 [Rivularia sp. PCC 7116]|nr:hypothetical protein Riv7116_6161 [Rivularia sp. PCC 7116]
MVTSSKDAYIEDFLAEIMGFTYVCLSKNTVKLRHHFNVDLSLTDHKVAMVTAVGS